MLRARSRRLASPAVRGARALSSALAEENAALRQQLEAMKREREALLSSQRPNGSHTGFTGGAAVEKSKFVGAQGAYSPELKFWYPDVDATPPVLPCFRLIDDLGREVAGSDVAMPTLDQDFALACINTMIRVNEFEKIFNDAQR